MKQMLKLIRTGACILMIAKLGLFVKSAYAVENRSLAKMSVESRDCGKNRHQAKSLPNTNDEGTSQTQTKGSGVKSI